MNPASLETRLEIGSLVTLYDEGTMCHAVLRLGRSLDGWVADIITGSVKDLIGDEFQGLRTQTLRAALKVVD
jgi:hypothetical protein